MTAALASQTPGREPAGQRLYFIGTLTAGSLIMKIFPAWARRLGMAASVVGVDLAMGSAREVYRRCLATIAADPGARGALITTHKAALYEAAADLFTSLDPYAMLCREVSNVLIEGGECRGLAKDPITAGLALRDMLEPEYWQQPGREAVCFGAGGAGLAIMVALLQQETPPARFVLVDSDRDRVDIAAGVLGRLSSACAVELQCHDDAARNDALVATAQPGSLVINATGLGKDRPGAPLTPGVVFPRGAVAWDLNYRGELRFLRLAARQARERSVRVHDGWRYFLHGWADVVADAFGIRLTPGLFTELSRIATAVAGDARTRRA